MPWMSLICPKAAKNVRGEKNISIMQQKLSERTNLLRNLLWKCRLYQRVICVVIFSRARAPLIHPYNLDCAFGGYCGMHPYLRVDIALRPCVHWRQIWLVDFAECSTHHLYHSWYDGSEHKRGCLSSSPINSSWFILSVMQAKMKDKLSTKWRA